MVKMHQYNNKSNIEKIFLLKTRHPFCYAPQEKINVIEVEDFSELGKLTALRFIEWLQLNPEGAISLPTGKTPEMFIKWTNYFLQNWNDKKVQEELSAFGLTSKKPQMNSYNFVQIDEFFPIDPQNENSFAFYINKFYFKEFGLDPKKALLMDQFYLSARRKYCLDPRFREGDIDIKRHSRGNGNPGKALIDTYIEDNGSFHTNDSLDNFFPAGKIDLTLRFRNPETKLEEIQQKIIFATDQFCTEYEQKILDLGGIGFFLGGIGLDGHIAFDIKGTDHFSTTHLSYINYETAVACAGSFGGIEFARNKTVTTIGLKTTTQNPTTTAIIMASGQEKAKVVKDAVENEPSNLYPATALQKLENSCFYITKNAAGLLKERQYQNLKKQPQIYGKNVQEILINISSKTNTTISDLLQQDLQDDRLGSLLTEKKVELNLAKKETTEVLRQKIQNGLKDISGKTFLHTGPHHDDIMLGYLPYIIDLTKNPTNKHFFAIMTSGFNSVTNTYMFTLTTQVQDFLEKNSEQFFLDLHKEKNFDVHHALKALAKNEEEKIKYSESLRLLRNLAEIFAIELKEINDLNKIKIELEKLKDYFERNATSKKDSPEIQKLKGKIREWEEELLWGHFGFYQENVFHKRLGFYSSKASAPEFERDIKPILELLEQIKPDVLTVTIDPMGSGPDTHYKVLQAIRSAVQEYLKNNNKPLEIWGYRNVWHKFLPVDANIFVPVDLNHFTILRNTFLTCYASQRKASFPSHEHDGPFCELVQKIMVKQFEVIKNCLGENFFFESDDSRLRAAQGLCFLKTMAPEEFLETTK